MAITALHVDASAGSDNNGGSSEGAAKVTGTSATTDGTATVQLDASSDLSTVVVGDSIRIAARVDGIRSTNIYEITGVNDGLNQVTVTPSPAAAAVQAWSIGGAWATVGKAEDVVRPGDKVWIKASADYAELVTFAAASVGDTTTGPIVWEGYTSTKGDGGVATITGSGSRNYCIDVTAPTNMYTVFKNIRFTNTAAGAGNHAVRGDAGTNHVKFKKCRFDNAGGDGVNLAASCSFEGCYAHNNGRNGFSLGGFAMFLGCISNSNTADGFEAAGGVFWKCIAFSNGGNAFISILATTHCFLECVADGDAKDTNVGFDIGVSYGTSTNICFINCVAYDCVTGVRGNSVFGERAHSRNNLVNGNTTAYSGFATYEGEVTSAPSFSNEGAQDYGPTSGSPLKNAGFGVQTNGWITQTGDNPDIGAVDETASGAGLIGPKTLVSGGRML